MTEISINLPLTIIILMLAVLAVFFAMAHRRQWFRLTCPVTHEERDVVMIASILEPEVWVDVLSCGRPGEKPLEGAEVTCGKECLHCARVLPVTQG